MRTSRLGSDWTYRGHSARHFLAAHKINCGVNGAALTPGEGTRCPACTISLTHSRARGADDGGRRRRDASYGVGARQPSGFNKSVRAHRRVLALSFGSDFIHWRRSGESWPSSRTWPAVVFLLMAAGGRGGTGSRRRAWPRDLAHRVRVCCLSLGDFIHWRRPGEGRASRAPADCCFLQNSAAASRPTQRVRGRVGASGLATHGQRAHRRVLALSFGPDFIHWRRSGESWPSVWPRRRLFFLRNSAAALADQLRGRVVSIGLATARVGHKQ